MLTRLLFVFTCVALLASARPAGAADLGTATLSWQPGTDTPQVAQAVDKGLWTKLGLTVKTSSTATGREAFEALIGGGVDYALMAELPPVIGAMQNQKFKVIATLSRYNGLRVVATMPLDSLKVLQGKKVGTPLGTNVAFQEFETLQGAGVTATLVNVAPPDIVPALSRGDIDAAFMCPQAYPLAKKVLGEKYNEKRTPGYASTFVLVATTDELTKHPERAKALLAGLLQGDALVAKDPAESAAVVSKAMGGLTPAPAIQALWADYKFAIVLDPALISLFEREGNWLHDAGVIKGPAPTPGLFASTIDPSFLRSLAPRNVTIK
jgi:ABC-type nitrate/sulfonate/bicarbonate transport system substrate-binding protein